MMYTIILSLSIFSSTLLFCYGNSNQDSIENILIHGVKQYTVVLDQTSSQSSANQKCQTSFGGSLAEITDATTLRLMNEKLYKLKDKVTASVHELWIWGRSKSSNGLLNLNENQPLETADHCLVLSNRNSGSDPITEKYKIYGKRCSGTYSFICEKYSDFVSSTQTFGIFPTYDSKIKWFSGHDQTSILNGVTVYEYDDGTYSYISCVALTYGTTTLPCLGYHSVIKLETAHTLELVQDQFITEVTGEQSRFLRKVKFAVSKGSPLGPVGKGINLATFRAYKNGSPLLFISGAAGMWLYQIQFHFFSFDNSNLAFPEQLKRLTGKIAKEVYDGIKRADLEYLVHLNDKYKTMLPDVATRGCNIFTYQEDPNFRLYEDSCSLKFLLEQLNIYTTSTTALKRHLPRNLMKIAAYRSEVLLSEVQKTKQFKNLLTSITFQIRHVGNEIQGTVIDVETERAQKLSNYLSSVASFDKQIAEGDNRELTDRIRSLETKSNKLMKRVNQDMKIMLGLAVGITSAEVVERGVRLAAAIGKAMNPFGWLFGGNDPNDIADAISDLTNAVQNAMHATRLLASLKTYVKYMKELSAKFAENTKLINGMKRVLKDLPAANNTKAKQIAAEFIDLNNDYDPSVSKHEIVYAAELLKAVIDEGCDLINGASGVLPDLVNTIKEVGFVIAEAVAKEPKSVCTNLQPSVSELEAMYESVYDFQFELIDALTRIVRGNIAEKMAWSIASIKANKTINVQTAAIGSMMVEIRCQAVVHARCQELEYKNGGKRPDICKHIHFTDDMIDEIIGYKITAPSSTDDSSAYIPMSPVSTDLTPYLDVKELIQDSVTYFHIPVKDKKWMMKYKWLPDAFDHAEYNKETSYYITKFEMYIPELKCRGLTDYDISVKVESESSARLFTENTPPTYIIPSTVFKFKYHKGPGCNRDTVDYTVRANNETLSWMKQDSVCVVSEGTVDTRNDPLLPTLFSTWKITLLTPTGCNVTIDSALTFEPLISVKLGVKHVLTQGIKECWPDTRCKLGQRCVDGTLSYTCQNN